MMLKRVFLEPRDNSKWSINSDFELMESLINNIEGYKTTKNIFRANIVYNLWWNNSRFLRFNHFLKKKFIATCSNFLNVSENDYELALEYHAIKTKLNAWIAPSQKQLSLLRNDKQLTYYMPFLISREYLNLEILDKKSICSELNIDRSIFKDKIIIGNFMRDSLGSNLSKSKWQKNPEMIVELCSKLKENYILLLAGPRRHFLRDLCKKNKINFYFYGDIFDSDDIIQNNLDIKKMKLLYQLTDIQLITSASEGGPKSIPEGMLTRNLVLSTNVGHSNDYLSKDFVFDTLNDFTQALIFYCNVENFYSEKTERVINNNYTKANNIQSNENLQNLLKNNLNNL